jgi:hypothetical protein
MKERSGIKTTEFWITAIVVLAGLLPSSGLLPENHWAVKVCGLVVSVAAALGYTMARAGVKKAGSAAAKLLLVALLIGLLAGCGGQGYIRAEAIEPAVRLVTGLHDKMLMGEVDPAKIKPEDKATYLRTSELLRSTVREAAENK